MMNYRTMEKSIISGSGLLLNVGLAFSLVFES